MFRYHLKDLAILVSFKLVICYIDCGTFLYSFIPTNYNVLVFRNGADRSGLFCVAATVIERMQVEQDVAIAQVIEEMRNYREEIVSSVVSNCCVHYL